MIQPGGVPNGASPALFVQNNWTVPATVVRVIDGDTILVTADLGWHVLLKTSVRIPRINAAESDTAQGRKDKRYAQTLVKPMDSVTVISEKLLGSNEKYGRALADVMFGNPPRSFAEAMLASGHAKPWDGKGESP